MKLNFLYKETPFFEFLDIYGLTGNLKIRANDSYSYFLSLVLSIISILSISSISLYLIINVYQRNSVSLLYQIDSMNYPVVNLTNYPFTFHLYDSNAQSLKNPDKIYYLTARFMEFKLEIDENKQSKAVTKIQNVTLEKCDLNKHFGKFKEYFLKATDTNLKYCIPPNSNNITLYGKYGDIANNFSILQVLLHKCKNGTNGKDNCHDEETINKSLNLVHMEYARIEYDINHNLVDDPKVITKKVDLYLLSSTIYTRINKYFSEINYSTDYGYIFKRSKTINFFQDDRYDIEVDLRKEGLIQGSFSSLTIMNSYKTQFYERKYVKLQDLLASIGGIIEGVFISCRIFQFLFSRNLFKFILFKSMFELLERPKNKNTKEKFENIIYKKIKRTENYSRIKNLKMVCPTLNQNVGELSNVYHIF
jgi:hypothetical protein